MLRARRAEVCPSCFHTIDNLYGRFVDPSNPVKDCPNCGIAVTKPERNVQIWIQK